MTDTSQTLRYRTPVRVRDRVAPVAQLRLRAAFGALSRVAPDQLARWYADRFTTPRRFPMAPREERWMRRARQSRLPFDGANALALYEWGQGPVVLLVHGFEGSASQLGGFAAPLVAAGFRVVAFDATAHGASDGTQTAIQEMIRALMKVAQHVGPVEAAVAHSLGTTALVDCLYRGLEAERAILIAPPVHPETYLPRIARHIGLSPKVAGRAQALLEARYGVPFEAYRPLAAARHLGQAALILHDGEDRQVPLEEGEKLARFWPGAELEVTHGLGHNRILRDPGVIAQVLGFVQSRG